MTNNLIIQNYNNYKDYSISAEPLPNSKGTKQPRITFLGLNEADQFHHAIAIKAISSQKPSHYFWEFGRYLTLEVYSNEGQKLYAEANRASIEKRFNITRAELNEYMASHNGDVSGMLSNLIAQRSDANVMTALGAKTTNLNTAAFWFQKAAHKGNPEAMNRWGLCLKNGEGVTKNESEAVSWFQKASELGHKEAPANQALMEQVLFEKGNEYSRKKEYEKAVDNYRTAARLNHPQALNALGLCYYEGTGVEKNAKKAAYCFLKASRLGCVDAPKNLIQLGDAEALFKLGYHYNTQKEFEKAAEFYQKAAELGHPMALNNLGVCYEKGEGVEKDIKKAFDLYDLAQQRNCVAAMNSIARLYEYGVGTERNIPIAMEWHAKAAEQGSAKDMFWLGKAYEFGNERVERNFSKAIHWYKKAAELDHKEAKEIISSTAL